MRPKVALLLLDSKIPHMSPSLLPLLPNLAILIVRTVTAQISYVKALAFNSELPYLQGTKQHPAMTLLPFV